MFEVVAVKQILPGLAFEARDYSHVSVWGRDENISPAVARQIAIRRPEIGIQSIL